MKPFFVSLLSLVSLIWLNSPGPVGRASAHLLYHAPSKGMLLFDGFQVDYSKSTTNVVWKWDGLKWSALSAEGPDGRSLTAAAVDTKANEIIDFGGIGQGSYEDKKADMWKFDGHVWKQVSKNSIGTRDHHRVVFADHLNAFGYGGIDANRNFDTTTWILSDGQFKSLQVKGPGLRYYFGMAYDRIRKKVVLNGGGKDKQREELWEFDGQQWYQMAAPQPGRRLRHALVYADHLKMTVLHGGSGGDDASATWGWDGNKWNRIATGGPVANMQALGYDPVRKVVVAFGGYDDHDYLTSAVWELKDGVWKMMADNGSWELKNEKYVRVNP